MGAPSTPGAQVVTGCWGMGLTRTTPIPAPYSSSSTERSRSRNWGVGLATLLSSPLKEGCLVGAAIAWDS